MATKFSNKNLLIVFAVLLGAFLLIRFLNSSKNRGNFDKNVVNIDTAQIKSISILPKASEDEITIFQNVSNEWRVKQGEKEYEAMDNTINSLINTLSTIKAQRLAARSSEKWADYELTDSAATRVEVEMEGENLVLLIGKFSYKQNQNPTQYSQQRGRAISYFRLDGQEEVYACDGFLNMTFNRDINAFRNQTFLKAKVSDLTSIDVKMPLDTGYTLQKVDSIWMISGENASEDKIQTYLNGFAASNQSQFVDTAPTGTANYSINLNGNNMEQIQIKAYQLDSANVIMNSTINPEAYFKVPKSGLFSTLFKSSSYFISE